MKKITAKDAIRLIQDKKKIHCFLQNPFIMPSSILVGWDISFEDAVESIKTSDELYLLDDTEAFAGHRLWCKNPKEPCPERQIFMAVGGH